MNISRRDLGLLLPALTAASASAQQQRPKLTSTLYHHEKVPYTGAGPRKGRRFFFGENHNGFGLEMHETVLPPGGQSHAPHKHVHEEVILIVEGKIAAFIEGTTEEMEPGSVLYFGSNEMHNMKNVGETPSRYYVIELRGPAQPPPA